MNDDLIKRLIAQKNYHDALTLLNDELDANPEDPRALFFIGNIMVQQDRRGLAYNLYARCLKSMDNSAEVWTQFGRCQDDTPEGWDKSEWCFMKAIDINPDCIYPYAQMAYLEAQRCRPEKAIEWAEKCFRLDPDYAVAKSAIGFASLMLGKWEEGWKNYDLKLGDASRPNMAYGDLPIWDGTKGKTVLVYGEQGIGDEILFASVFPDMLKDCRVIYDTMPRLQPLMQRSFPDMDVIGGRWETSVALKEGWEPDARISQASVLQYYRRQDSDFPRKPYLKAHEGMRVQMRALLDSLGDKPKIGITWTGGTKRSRGHFRQQQLADLAPLLSDDATWISLQYRDPSEEIAALKDSHDITVHHFDWITEIKEYDPTAALVKELDLVITVPTSVSQLSGALGVPCWVRVPEITGWLFSHEPYVWADSVELFRNTPIEKLRERLDLWLSLRTTRNSSRRSATG